MKFLGVARERIMPAAKTQLLSTYLKGPIVQWGARRGVSGPIAEHIAIVLVVFIKAKKKLPCREQVREAVNHTRVEE